MNTTRHVTVIEGEKELQLTLEEPLTLGEIWDILAGQQSRPARIEMVSGVARVTLYVTERRGSQLCQME